MIQPSAELDIALQSADKGLKSTSLNFGTWNSLHTGNAGLDSATSGFGCACGKLWYESDFYTTLALGFSGGGLGATYTAYTSPNAGFNNVKEIMFKFTGDDSAALGKAAMHPWAIVAVEFDADNGHQADGGSKAGKYLELGVSPGYSGAKAGIAIPVKVGLSIGDYYELNEGTAAVPNFVDHKFGYLSIAGIVTVPIKGHDEVRRLERPLRRRVPEARRHDEGVQRRRRQQGHSRGLGFVLAVSADPHPGSR